MMHALILAWTLFLAPPTHFQRDLDIMLSNLPKQADVYDWMVVLSPETASEELADAIASHAMDKREAALLTAVAYFESKFKPKVVGDHGQSHCALQVMIKRPSTRTPEGWTGRQLSRDVNKCVSSGLRVLRYSMNACKNHPPPDRLAMYKSGRCTRGIQQSRENIRLAEKLLNIHIQQEEFEGHDDTYDMDPDFSED